jgi:hypothetical protein
MDDESSLIDRLKMCISGKGEDASLIQPSLYLFISPSSLYLPLRLRLLLKAESSFAKSNGKLPFTKSVHEVYGVLAASFVCIHVRSTRRVAATKQNCE